jgi:hypothetical protein
MSQGRVLGVQLQKVGFADHVEPTVAGRADPGLVRLVSELVEENEVFPKGLEPKQEREGGGAGGGGRE